MASKELVKAGMAWRIGNGSKIPIQGEKWIGSNHPMAPQSFLPTEHNLQCVAKLIDQDTREWNEERVRSCFGREEADRVIAIPLSQEPVDDKVIWSPDKKGKYTIKSAYHLAISMFSNVQRHRTSSSMPETGWKKLWHCKILLVEGLR